MVLSSPTIDGGVTLKDPTESGAVEETSTNDKQLSDYIGGGAYPDAGLSIGIGEEGRATESITTGTGDGTAGTGAGGPDIAADPTTTHVGTLSPDTSVQETQAVEQELEETSGGTAFGDPSKVEEIGSGEAVKSSNDPTEDEGSTGPRNTASATAKSGGVGVDAATQPTTGGLPSSLLVAGAALLALLYWGT